MSGMFRPNKASEKVKNEDVEVFQKKYAVFRTVDGEMHRSQIYQWCKVSDLLRSYEEYMMISLTSDGYLTDVNGSMYPLANIVSIHWVLQDEVKTASYVKYDPFKVRYSDSEIEKIKKRDLAKRTRGVSNKRNQRISCI